MKTPRAKLEFQVFKGRTRTQECQSRTRQFFTWKTIKAPIEMLIGQYNDALKPEKVELSCIIKAGSDVDLFMLDFKAYFL